HVGDDAVEHVQAVVGVGPLAGDVVVDDVALMEHEGDVAGGVLGDDPGGLRVEEVGIARRVVLGVGQDHDAVGEGGRRVGAGIVGRAGVPGRVAAGAAVGAGAVGSSGRVAPGDRSAVR